MVLPLLGLRPRPTAQSGRSKGESDRSGRYVNLTSCGECSSRTRASAEKQLELALAPDERCDGSLRDVDAEASAGLQRLPDDDRLALALCDNRLCLAIVDDLLRRAVGLLEFRQRRQTVSSTAST